MQGAELTGTNLKGADMLDAEGLTTSQLEEAETDEPYKSFLDTEIFAIDDEANAVFKSVDDIARFYDTIRGHAEEIITKVNGLREESKLDMSEIRSEWCCDAVEIAGDLIKMIKTEKQELSDVIKRMVFGASDGASDEE